MIGNLALGVQERPLRVDTERHQHLGGLHALALQLCRVVVDRHRVEIDDAIDGVVIVLKRDPVPEGTQVVAQMDVPGGLDPGEDAGLGFGVHGHSLLTERNADGIPPA